jgi:NADPH:quinone reductase-like Zn-dependent oxidoreductase
MLISRTTKAIVLEAVGFDNLVEQQRCIPTPGPSQVLVRMKAASLNYRDLKIVNGTYNPPPVKPIVPLSDGAGDIVEVGSGVSRFKVGERALPIYMEGWYSGPMDPDRKGWKSRAGDIDGTAIEYSLFDEADVVHIPDSLSYEEAACLPCAGVTAWHALVSVGQIKAGDTVLIMGSGGVSIAGLQIAKMSGARVIATSSCDDKLNRLMALGASDGINYAKEPNWGNAVRKLTGGRGVDHVLEVGGVNTLAQSIRATKDGGRIENVGNLTGKFLSDGVVERGIAVTLIAVGSRQMTEDLMRAIDLHAQKPLIDSRFPISELKQALRYLEAGKHFGKVVLNF